MFKEPLLKEIQQLSQLTKNRFFFLKLNKRSRLFFWSSGIPPIILASLFFLNCQRNLLEQETSATRISACFYQLFPQCKKELFCLHRPRAHSLNGYCEEFIILAFDFLIDVVFSFYRLVGRCSCLLRCLVQIRFSKSVNARCVPYETLAFRPWAVFHHRVIIRLVPISLGCVLNEGLLLRYR